MKLPPSAAPWATAAVFFWMLLIPVQTTAKSWLHFREIALKGVSSSGTITQLTPGIHNTAKYQFTVADRLYTGSTRIEQGTTVGESVAVHYLVNDPVQNSLHPVDLAQEMFISTIAMLMLTFILPIGVFFEYRRRSRLSS